MNKLTSYYKAVIDRAAYEGNQKLSNPGYYLNALAFIEREAALVEQERQTSRQAGLIIEDYLITCHGITTAQLHMI